MIPRQHTAAQSTGTQRPPAGRLVLPALLVCALLSPWVAEAAQNGSSEPHHPAPIERRNPASDHNSGTQQAASQRNTVQPSNRPETAGQRHLGEWLEQHQGLSLSQQQKALDNEPGFRRLQPQVQQRMNQRLQQLSTMSPERRNRAVERIEAMERLSPDQRQQVRGAMRQLGSLPPDRRRAVALSFHALQLMPSQDRQQYLNSPQVRSQFSEEERSTLDNLVRVAPLLPPPTAPAPQR